MNLWIVSFFFVLLPSFCLAQPVTNLEIESGTESPESIQAHERAQKKGAYKLRVRYVKVEGRWTGPIKLPLEVGDILTPEKVSQAMEALKLAITNDTVQGYPLRSKGEVGVVYIDVDFDTRPPPDDTQQAADTVGVIFRPYFIDIALVEIGNSVLPIPRSPLPTFFDNVPKPLLALKPTLALSRDRSFGTALGGSFAADLLKLSDPARLSAASGADRRLDVHAQGMKSLDETFYRIHSGLRYNSQQIGPTLQEFSLRADYNGVKEPLGLDQHTGNSGIGGVGVGLKLAPNTRLALDASYRWTDDTLRTKVPGQSTHTLAVEQANRLLFETIPRRTEGFLRAVLWEDNGWQTASGGSYQRLAGRFGYAKEIPVKENQTVGVEILAGGGKVWNDTPNYLHFFGGNLPGQFLYDSRSSTTLLNMPTGPLIRSFGEGEAAIRANQSARGGNAFWNVNLNVAVPIAPWSRPLIPNELTDLTDANGNPVSLKQLLRRQVDVTGPNMLAATLVKEGMSDAEAATQAGVILDEVKPATHFLIDYANLYSVKPLFMFDAGGLHGGGRNRTWLAAGGGMQLTIVIAKFEVGYMHTISGPASGSRGNAFFRLVFQNLF